MIVGFTGTREGMTPAQSATVGRWMAERQIECVHHGECVGADTDFDMIAHLQGLDITVHPPEDKRLWQPSPYATAGHGPRLYHDRNRDIVNESGHLLATPKEASERAKGGTWYTIRYAIKEGTPVTIVWPDGSIEDR